MRLYFNNGHSFRAWPVRRKFQPGEVWFDHVPTEDELRAAFPDYDATKPPPKE